MSERIVTVGGPNPTRPLSEFDRNIAGTKFYVGPNATGVGDDERSGRSKESSVATLTFALSLATASKGDIIYLLPGHAETLSTAAAIAINKIGVRIVGLGIGALRPTFTFSAVDATMTMTAASGSIENVIIKPSIDAVVSPIVVSAADCKIDVEIQDESATVECECGILTTAAAERLDIDLKYSGFIAGDACVNAIRLVGVDTARINVDFYGVASTSIVEFHTTACHDIDITGKFYNDGTSLTANVVDTATGSTWSVQGWDGNSNANFTGGDNAAIASDDISAIGVDVAAILVDTAVIGALGAGLTDLGGMATGMKGEVQVEMRGNKVTHAAGDLLDTVQNALFTIGTGRVLIFGLVGQISGAAIAAGASATNFIYNPTTGTDSDLCGTLDIDADEINSIYSMTGTPGDALTGGTDGHAVGMIAPIILDTGTIDVVSAANSGSGGALLTTDIWWLPLDTGATLVST